MPLEEVLFDVAFKSKLDKSSPFCRIFTFRYYDSVEALEWMKSVFNICINLDIGFLHWSLNFIILPIVH